MECFSETRNRLLELYHIKDFKRGVNYSAIFVLVSRFFSMSYKVGFLLEDESYNCRLLEGKELVPTII